MSDSTEQKKLTKEDVVAMVDAAGHLVFDHWYKNDLHYKNDEYHVILRPDYRDHCGAMHTLAELLNCDDYESVQVLKGKQKPYEDVFYHNNN